MASNHLHAPQITSLLRYHKRELVNETTRILPVSSPPDELCDRTALEADLTESNMLNLDFRSSPFFFLLLRLGFAFPTRSCTMLLCYQFTASCVATKDQKKYSNQEFPSAVCFQCFGSCFTFDSLQEWGQCFFVCMVTEQLQ